MEGTGDEDEALEYIRPADVETSPNLKTLERTRGDLMNKVAYGLLTEDDVKSIFSDETKFPITYGVMQGPYSNIDDFMTMSDEVFATVPCVSISSITNLVCEVTEKFQTKYAEARLVNLLWDLVYVSRVRDRSTLLLDAGEKEPFSEGLSPIFTVQDLSEFHKFVDSLNDPDALAQLPVQRSPNDVLAVAISYKHHTIASLKLSPGHITELKVSLPLLARELGVIHFQFWIDRILSAKKQPDDRTWWKAGLAPYLELPVLYVCGDDRSDAKLMEEMNTMWINIERVAAAIGRGMMSYGKRFDRHELPKCGIVFENARESAFDWWICNDGEQRLSPEEKMHTLLFAIGNSEMLERETYFEHDKDMLMAEARKVFATPRAVLAVYPVTNYCMRDYVVFKELDGVPWRGEEEWCVNFKQHDECGRGGRELSLFDSAHLLAEPIEIWKFGILDEEAVAYDWVVMYTARLAQPVVALAVKICDGDVSDRATVVVDSPGELSIYADTAAAEDLPKVEDMLQRWEVLKLTDKLVSIHSLHCDDAFVRQPRI